MYYYAPFATLVECRRSVILPFKDVGAIAVSDVS
jgi:hypothetical protein